MKTLRQSYALTAAGINACCEELRRFAKECGLPQSDLTRLVLGTEEALLRYQSRFPDERELTLDVSLRFGRLRMNLLVPGEAYNVIDTDDEPDEFALAMSDMFNRLVLSLSHSYRNGVNCISCEKPVSTDMSFLLQLAIAIAAGVGVGFLCRLLPAAVVEPLDALLTLINNTLMGLIKMAALPVIFLYTMKGIADCGGISAFGKIAKKTLGSLFGSLLLILFATLGMSLLLLPFSYQSTADGMERLSATFSILFSVFPDNIVAPFSNGDNIKVLFISVLVGCALLTLGKRGESISRALGTLCDVSSKVMEWMCKPIPLLIGIMIFQNVRDPSMLHSVAGAWQPCVVMFAVYIGTIVLDAVIVARKKKMRLSAVLSGLAQPVLKGFTTGSSILTYPDVEQTLKKNYKTEPRFCRFSLPLAMTFYQPVILLGCVSLYFAYLSGVVVTPAWLLSFLLLGYIAAVAIPPVTGGVVAMLAFMFTSLGVDSSYLALGTSILMLLDYPNTGGRVAMIILEIARISESKTVKEK